MVVEHAKAENYYSINIKELSMDDGALSVSHQTSRQ